MKICVTITLSYTQVFNLDKIQALELQSNKIIYKFNIYFLSLIGYYGLIIISFVILKIGPAIAVIKMTAFYPRALIHS